MELHGVTVARPESDMGVLFLADLWPVWRGNLFMASYLGATYLFFF
jgi:hypothetical protein